MNLSVNTAAFRTRSSELKGYRVRIGGYESSLMQVNNVLNDDVWRRCGVTTRLKSLCRQMEECMGSLSVFGDAVLDIKLRYEDAEKKICGLREGDDPIINLPDSIQKLIQDENGNNISDFRLSDLLDFLKDHPIGRLSGDAITEGSDLAGFFLTLLLEGYDNFVSDTEGNSFDRMLAETINETGINFLEGTVIGSSVAIIATALIGGLITSPVLVAVVSAGVTVLAAWAIKELFDSAMNIAFKGDWIEKVSDKMLDGVEDVKNWLSERASDVYDWTTDAAEDIGDAVVNGTKTFVGWLKGLV